ncbi:MAG: phosphoribosyl-AMP cyclohydrolase [Lentisphaeria bacterium]
MIKPAFEKFSDQLVPVVVQDIDSKEVLMMAYANKEAYENTINTGNATYWSRSRNEIWVKGLTSGNTQKIVEVRIDCDCDTLLYLVKQNGGAACHEGYSSCFFRLYNQEHADYTVEGKLVFDPKQVYKK